MPLPVAVPVTPFCLSCGWDFGANHSQLVADKATPSTFCSSCGADLKNFEDGASVDQSAFLVPPLVVDIAPTGISVDFTYTENPLATTEEFISRINGGAFTAPALATGGVTVVLGTAGQVIDIRYRSVGASLVIDGPFSPVATGTVSP